MTQREKYKILLETLKYLNRRLIKFNLQLDEDMGDVISDIDQTVCEALREVEEL